MTKKTGLATLAVVAITFFLLLAYRTVFVVRGSAGGVGLYWNANEALLFMATGNSGARMSYARYELEPFVESLGYVRQPNDERCSQLVVIRITDADVQRYETDLWRHAEVPYCGFHVVPFEGRLYGYFGPDHLWRWSGSQFEAATPQVSRAFDEAKVVARVNSQHPWQFDDVEGWSMRDLGATGPKQQIVLNGHPVTITFHGLTWPPRPLSVELTRPGQPPRTIWSFDERPHRLSKAEYQRLFQTP